MKWIGNIWFFITINLVFLAANANGVTNKCLGDFKSHTINADTIWFDDCGLNDNDIPVLFSYLQTHKEITQVYLLNNNISDQGAIILSKNTTLQMLELRNNKIGKKGALALANSSIHMIDLQGNKFNSKHLASMALRSFRNKIQKPDEVIILG